MYAIRNTIKILFPATANKMVSIDTSQVMLETDKGSTFKRFEWTGTTFLNFDAVISNDIASFFNKYKSHDIFNHNCDGVTLFEENGQRYMFLSELKSSFDHRIAEAKIQLISSFLKFNMLLNLMPGWQMEHTIIKGFIISPPPSEEKKSDWIRVYRRHSNSAKRHEFNKAAFFGQLLQQTDKGHPIKLTSATSHHLGPCRLGERAFPADFELRYIPVPAGAPALTLPVTPYL